jgi:hypothetical protein
MQFMKQYQIWGYRNQGNWFGYQPIEFFSTEFEVIKFLEENLLEHHPEINSHYLKGHILEQPHGKPIIFIQEVMIPVF